MGGTSGAAIADNAKGNAKGERIAYTRCATASTEAAAYFGAFRRIDPAGFIARSAATTFSGSAGWSSKAATTSSTTG